MARRVRRDTQGFSLSFLDCICCGFGAIILLLVLTKIYEPSIIERARTDLDSLIAELQETLFDIRGETAALNREMKSAREELATKQEQLSRLRAELRAVSGQYAASNTEAVSTTELEGELRAARQRLTEEMRRLQAQAVDRPDAPVGGIPVDSEYIIFVIDTSGSMKQYSWDLVRRKITETLELYPQVKGIQIMNDNGAYMFENFARKWITDSPELRRSIVQKLSVWNAFSDSNPMQGINAAIRTFWAEDKRISIYVFGDEFTGKSIEVVADAVDRMNRPDASGRPRVRIHGVGFPLLFRSPGQIQQSTVQFAALMREICRRNGGTFVALTER